LNRLEALFRESKTPREYVRGYCDRLKDVLDTLDADVVARVVEVFETVAANDRTLFTIANGGSAAAASHIVNDLCPNSYVEGQPSYRVMCLTDSITSITAIANDSGYDEIFVQQLRALMRPGDVVLALSASGNSPNIVKAVEYANAHGATTVGFCGFDGGRLAQIAQVALHAPATRDEYGPVEDLFSVLGHIIVGYITMKRGRMLGH
jgi:D-sedoheptulose 7-phosphate isomerase